MLWTHAGIFEREEVNTGMKAIFYLAKHCFYFFLNYMLFGFVFLLSISLTIGMFKCGIMISSAFC